MSASDSPRESADETVYFPMEIRNHYDVKHTIGSGGLSKVKLARHRLSDELVAIKIVDRDKLKNQDDFRRVPQEIDALRELRHPNISRLFQVVKTDTKYYLVMEYASGGELFDYIVSRGRCKESEAVDLFTQVCLAISFAHSKGFAHRDIKPENILFDENRAIKMIDFGLVGRCDANLTFCGSVAYAAPEILLGKPYSGEKADVWSLGVVLYTILCGWLPFDNSNPVQQIHYMQKGMYEIPAWLSSDACDVLKKMLTFNPEHRPSVEALMKLPWFTKSKYLSEYTEKYRRLQDSYAAMHQDVIEQIAHYYAVQSSSIEFTIKQRLCEPISVLYDLLVVRKENGRDFRLPNLLDARGMRPKRNSLDAVTKVKELAALSGEIPDHSIEQQPSHQRRASDSAAHPNESSSPLGSDPDTKRLIRELRASRLSGEKKGEARASLSQEPMLVHARKRGYSMPADVTKALKHTRPPPVSSSVDREDEESDSSSSDEYNEPSPGPSSLMHSAENVGVVRPRGMSEPPLPQKSSKTSSPATAALLTHVSSVFSNSIELNSPRELRGLFSVETTSTKSPEKVVEELVRVLRRNNVSFARERMYVMKVHIGPEMIGGSPVTALFEVCRVAHLNLTGLRLKRLSGDIWAYKQATGRLLSQLNI